MQTGFRQRSPRMARALAVLVVLLLLPTHDGIAASATDDWEAYLADRPALSNQLAPPFVECFQRRDSLIDPLSPIFHGCLDWHSAVHAAYSHVALYANTGAYAYRHLVQEKIAPLGVSLVPAEHAYQIAKGLDRNPLGENPYGFGWFLILARAWEEATGGTEFREMAAYAADAMTQWFTARQVRGDARGFILDRAHGNYSWSLINLDIWARYTGDASLQDTVRSFALPLLDASLDTSCPTHIDTSGTLGGFQPACLMRLAAAGHVWGAHVAGWIAARIPAGLHVPPVTNPVNCHAGGQNFSRAFALYQIHLVTGDEHLRDNYVELIRYHVSRPDLYIDPDYLGSPGYLCYSHWVAQFGVRAIALSSDEPPVTPEAGPVLP